MLHRQWHYRLDCRSTSRLGEDLHCAPERACSFSHPHDARSRVMPGGVIATAIVLYAQADMTLMLLKENSDMVCMCVSSYIRKALLRYTEERGFVKRGALTSARPIFYPFHL